MEAMKWQERSWRRQPEGGLRSAIALLVVLAFATLFIYMLLEAKSAGETRWARLSFLFGSAEAVAFTVVGWLFGREVHREQANRAEARVDAAADNANKAVAEERAATERGYALAELIRSSYSGRTQSGGMGESANELLAEVGATNGPPVLLHMANALFPRR